MSYTSERHGYCMCEDCDCDYIEPGDEVEVIDGDLMHHACAERERNR